LGLLDRIAPRKNESDPDALPEAETIFATKALRKFLACLTSRELPVLIDFTADWCLNCKSLDRWVLNTAPVKEAVMRNAVVPLVADYTDIPPELTKMLSLLKAGAVPVLAPEPVQASQVTDVGTRICAVLPS
jgi:thiol:disulfide interchange protein